MNQPDEADSATTEASLIARLAAAERALAARDKTIAALVDRERSRAANRHSTFDVMEENTALQQVVACRTLELEAQNARLTQEIAARKAAEVELQRSEASVRLVMESIAEGFYAVDPRGYCTLVNRACLRLTGYDRQEEMVGRHIHELIHHTRADGTPYPATECRMYEALRNHTGTHVDDEVFWRRDGTSFPVEYWSHAILRDGQLLGAVATFFDITERKRADAELEKLHRQLLEASRAAGMAEVATGVLHNVGNVLNSVNVSATLVADQVRESKAVNVGKLAALFEQQTDLVAFLTADPRGRRVPGYLATLRDSLAREQATVLAELDCLRTNLDHIKAIVAMQQSYATTSGFIETIPLVDLVEDALRLNASALLRHGVEVRREFEHCPTISTDKHKIVQILINLVLNASRACAAAGPAARRITVRTEGDAQRLRITVTDNGVGIPRENLTRIFNHGFTTGKDGHGFGLHSGACAAKELGGALTAHSDGPGRGATFTLELPVRPREATGNPAPSP